MNEQSEVLRGRLHFLLPPFLFTRVTVTWWNCLSPPLPPPSPGLFRPQTHASTSAWSSAPSFHLSAICPSLCPVGLRFGALPCSCVLASLSPCPARPQQSLPVQPGGARALGPLWSHSQHGQVMRSISKGTGSVSGYQRGQPQAPAQLRPGFRVQGTRTSGF